MEIGSIGNQVLATVNGQAGGAAIGGMTSAAGAATRTQTETAVTPPSPAQLGAALKDINKALENAASNLEFTVDDESHRTIVKVVDRQTGDVIRQMPSEEALQIARALDRMSGNLIQQEA